MIIGIDASKAASTKKTGIDNTAYQIILGLTKIDTVNNYYLYTNAFLPKELLANKNFQEKLIPFPRFWNRFRLPLAIMRDKPNIFLELTSNIPPYSPDKTIVLIHDLAFRFFPEAYSKYEQMLQENAIRTALKRASVIVFTTKANHDDFIKFYGKPKAKTIIIPIAYDSSSFNKSVTGKASDFPYFLSVGRIEKRKNTLRIVEAFELFKENNSTNHKLMLVGKNGFGSDEVEKKISSSKYKKDIIVKGFVKNSELPLLYKNANAFLYPSLYEGFGLSDLESMAVGTPVITSNIPTIKEVIGDAAILVNPEDIISISDAMTKLATDKNYQKSLIQKGNLVIKKYSWDKTAAEYYKLINEIK